MNLKKAGLVALMDVLLLAELTLSIYLGKQEPENMTWTFFRTFLPLAAVTILACRTAVKRFCRVEPAPEPDPPTPWA
ncbi:MAG: hypothetical protein AB1641_11775 [Thermodesulfobacteriota bacterium]